MASWKSRMMVAPLAACALFFLAGPLFAQFVPSVSDVIRKQAGEVPPDLVLDPEEPLSIQVLPVPETTADLTVSLQVNRFLIRNNVMFPTLTLSRLVAPWEGRELTLAQVHEAAREITSHYQEHGYFLARAYVPAQEVRDGVVEIIVLEGTLGEVMIDGNRYYRDCYIESFFIPVKYDMRSYARGRGAINYAQLERALLLLNDHINLDARATFQPGKELYDTDLFLNVEDSLPVSGYFDFNNFGSRWVSRSRLGAALNVGNLTGRGDVLLLRGVAGIPPSQMTFGSIGWDFPVNCHGTRMGVSYSHLNFEVGRKFKILGMEGRSTQYGVYARHPLIRSQRRNLTLEAAFDRKSFRNYIFGDYVTGDDTLSVLKIGGNFNNTDYSGRNYLSAHLHHGIPDIFGSMDRNAPQASRYAAGVRELGGQFTKVTLDTGRIQRLNLDGFNRVAAMFTGSDCADYDPRIGYLILRMQGQYTNDDLVTGEQFTLGGPDTVRGYSMGEYSADRGFALSAELRAPILRDRFPDRVQLAFFTDYGRGYINTVIPDENRSNSLSGAGLGLRAELPWETNLRLECAWRIAGKRPSDGHRPAVYLQMMKSF